MQIKSIAMYITMKHNRYNRFIKLTNVTNFVDDFKI